MIATAILVRDGTAADVMRRIEIATSDVKLNGSNPIRLLEQAHGWVVVFATELSLTRPTTAESIKRREKLLTALDDAIVRYQRRAALLGLRGTK